MYVWLVILRNATIALLEPKDTSMQKPLIICVYCENAYLICSDPITIYRKKKAETFNHFKDVYI